MSSPDNTSSSYNSRSIYNFERLTGAENFFIWGVRMLDVLADKDILYVIESDRPADPIPEAEADLLVTDDYEDDIEIICNPVTSDPVASGPVASASEPGTSDPATTKPVASDDTAEASQPSQEATSQAAREAANAEKQKRTKAHDAYTSYASNVYESQDKWDRDSRKGMAAIQSDCRDAVLLRMGSYKSARELWNKL
jgi:hypothetical protein